MESKPLSGIGMISRWPGGRFERCGRLFVLGNRNSVFSAVSGLVFTHTGDSGEPARSRSTKKRLVSRPLADSLEAQNPQSSEGGGRVLLWTNPRAGVLLFLLFIFLRASASQLRSSSDERAKD
jgi:hypothetical protein